MIDLAVLPDGAIIETREGDLIEIVTSVGARCVRRHGRVELFDDGFIAEHGPFTLRHAPAASREVLVAAMNAAASRVCQQCQKVPATAGQWEDIEEGGRPDLCWGPPCHETGDPVQTYADALAPLVAIMPSREDLAKAAYAVLLDSDNLTTVDGSPSSTAYHVVDAILARAGIA